MPVSSWLNNFGRAVRRFGKQTANPPTASASTSLFSLLPGLLLGAVGSPWTFPLFPDRASTIGWQTDIIFFFWLAFSTLLTSGIVFFILFFIWRYRAGTPADRSNPIRHTLKIEGAWILLPTLIALGAYVWTTKVYFDEERPPADATAIYVTGKQWMWKIRHKGGPQEINALHVPVGEDIKLVMTSQDVIHDFYVPAFRVKQDVLPDQYTTLWFNATKPGKFHLFCSEYCGKGHSQMGGWVTVMKPAAYEKWLAGQPQQETPLAGTPGAPGAPLKLEGQGLFHKYGCNACHLASASVRAPRLDGIFGRKIRLSNGKHVVVDEQYIRESILYPDAKIVAGYPKPSLMPSYVGQIKGKELAELVEFIKSIRHGWPKGVPQQ